MLGVALANFSANIFLLMHPADTKPHGHVTLVEFLTT